MYIWIIWTCVQNVEAFKIHHGHRSQLSAIGEQSVSQKQNPVDWNLFASDIKSYSNHSQEKGVSTLVSMGFVYSGVYATYGRLTLVHVGPQ